jgi:hypothetical protein
MRLVRRDGVALPDRLYAAHNVAAQPLRHSWDAALESPNAEPLAQPI